MNPTKVPDIPKQYKALNDKKVFELLDAGLWLFAIATELGQDEYQVENEKILISIKRSKT